MSEHQHQDAGTFIEVGGADLDFRRITVFDSTPSGDQILGYCDFSPREEYVVLQWLPEGDIEEIRPDESVDLRNLARARFIIEKTDRLFRFILNDRTLAWPRKSIPVHLLRTLGEIADGDSLFIKREEVADQRLEDEDTVSLASSGVENIYSKREAWKLNVQGVVIESEQPEIRVRAALVEAGFDPDQGWIIVLKTADAKRQVTIEDVIDLRTPGIEKLRLTPREINNGLGGRRDFQLLESDEVGLAARGLKWETIDDNGRRWLLIREFQLPAGFSVPSTTIALDIPPSYPSGEIDMFYCCPHLTRQGGGTIAQADVPQNVAGVSFQRWSRHRGGGSPWRPGVDNVLTHLALVEAALLREVER
jgi:hypothetical protein